MATRISSTLFADNSTDANFRAWVQFWEDTFITTGGWAVTGDTGMMTISTATKPGVSNTKVGYRIYKMQDTLSSTKPCYIKFYFGSGSGGANSPAVWFTIGTGSDGAGTITGVLYRGETSTTADIGISGSSAVQATNSYGSADSGRASLGMFVNAATTALVMIFTIERSVASGAATGEGFMLSWTGMGSNSYNKSLFVTATLGQGQFPVEPGIPHILSGQNPSAFNSVVGIGVLTPIQGVSKQPGLNVILTRSSDFTAESQIVVSLYGVNHTYQNLRGPGVTIPGGSVISTTIPSIRYE